MRFLKPVFIPVFSALVVSSSAQENVITRASRLMGHLESYSIKESLKSEAVGEPVEVVREKMVAKNGLIYISHKADWGQDEAYISTARIAVKKNQKWEIGTEKEKGQWGQLLGLPITDFDVLKKEVKSLQRTGKSELVGGKECAIYEEQLDDEAAKELAGLNYWRNAQFRGVAKLWIGKGDIIYKYEFVINYRRTFGGTQIDGKITRVEELSHINETSVLLPEEVAMLFKNETSR